MGFVSFARAPIIHKPTWFRDLACDPFRPMAAKRARTVSNTTASDDNYIDLQDFNALVSELTEYDQQRETVIKSSRDVLKLSKQAIYAIHRGDTDDAQIKIKSAEQAAHELLPLIVESPTLRQGAFSSAIEEYAEAVIFLIYTLQARVATRAEITLADAEEYLGGVLDFTGELNRVAVQKATQRDKASVQRARDVVEGLQGQFLRFDFRNGNLRKKYDALKYTLRKLENTLYELSLTEAGGGMVPKPQEAGQAEDNDNE